MRVIVTVQHAGHVHFFKHTIDELEERGHEVRVLARDNEASIELLDACDIEYDVLAGGSSSLLSLAVTQGVYEARVLGRAREFEPDVMAAIGGVAVSHVAPLVGARSVVFYDTEHATIIRRLAFPFADTVCTPECFRDDIGAKQVRYPSYHELAYLHPAAFEADTAVLEAVGLSPDDTVALVRLGDWNSSHDMGASGIDDPAALVEQLEARDVEVLLCAEGDLPEGVESRGFSLDPGRFHDLLGAIDLYVGEGGTTAAECAVLGTPAVYVSDLTLGYLDELETAYGLVQNCAGEGTDAVIEAACAALEQSDAVFQRRRQAMLAEKTNPRETILEQIIGTSTHPAPETGPVETPAEPMG
jgi:predicted glycosyltransferase